MGIWVISLTVFSKSMPREGHLMNIFVKRLKKEKKSYSSSYLVSSNKE